MRASPLWLLALVPWVPAPPAHAPLTPETPLSCALALELHIRAPLILGALQVSVTTGDVEHAWAPYGLSFCWGPSSQGCEGLEVRVVLFAPQDTRTAASDGRTRSWISN